MKPGVTAAILIVLLFSLISTALEQDANHSRPEVQVFTIKHRKLNDVILRIKPFLSKEATLTINYAENSIQVKDQLSNLELAAREIVNFDRRPFEIRLQVTVLSAHKEYGIGFPATPKYENFPENASYIPGKLDRLFNYGKYRFIDTLKLKTTEGDNYILPENSRYNLQFYTDFVDEKTGAVLLKDFTLFLKNKLPSGVYATHRLLRTDINLIPGQKLILGGTEREESDEAIFFIIETEMRK